MSDNPKTEPTVDLQLQAALADIVKAVKNGETMTPSHWAVQRAEALIMTPPEKAMPPL